MNTDRANNFLAARDFLRTHREDYNTAYKQFNWPVLNEFNWALDYFDEYAKDNFQTALWIVDEQVKEEKVSYSTLSIRSNQVANYLRSLGVKRGDRILLMLPNITPMWEVCLAAMKLGAVVSPATMLLSNEDLQDRVTRGKMRIVITDNDQTHRFNDISGDYLRITTDRVKSEWLAYEDSEQHSTKFTADGVTLATDPMLIYFTSGTTAKPKMVLHTHQSYPVGHLSTMYWLGLQEGDIHYNISSPGWAKHSWSCLFAPWNAGATVFIYNQERFDPQKTLKTLANCKVSSMCAPPTAWRTFILEDLASYKVELRELISAGEPLNPEVIEQVEHAWGVTIREGYGQTETTAMLGCPPGTKVKPGSMGRPLPGYSVCLLDDDGKQSEEGELSINLAPAPIGLMVGYADNDELTQSALGSEHYGTSDVASIDEDGFYWFIGRTDDVFKSSDYRISPFELESVLVEHPAVAEAAVVESPDPKRLCVPKAFLTLAPEVEQNAELALDIFKFVSKKVGPYKRIRRIEFSSLPKTVSGKIKRKELRSLEIELRKGSEKSPNEYEEKDFPSLSRDENTDDLESTDPIELAAMLDIRF